MANKRFTVADPYVRKGIELHLDVLLDAMEDGSFPSNGNEIAAVKVISDRIGGFDAATSTFAHATDYERRTRSMMAKLGEFYTGLATIAPGGGMA